MITNYRSDNIEECYKQACSEKTDIYYHIPKLRELAESIDDVIIVEFGVRTGTSTIGFLSAKPKQLISYDLEKKPQHNQIRKVVEKADLCWDIIYGDIKETTKTNQPPECDIIMFDSEHSYDQLKFELQFADRARKYLIFHDTETFWYKANVPHKLGIGYAINDFLEENKKWTIKYSTMECNGLMVFERINQ